MLYSCTHMATVGVKGLKTFVWLVEVLRHHAAPSDYSLRVCYKVLWLAYLQADNERYRQTQRDSNTTENKWTLRSYKNYRRTAGGLVDLHRSEWCLAAGGSAAPWVDAYHRLMRTRDQDDAGEREKASCAGRILSKTTDRPDQTTDEHSLSLWPPYEVPHQINLFAFPIPTWSCLSTGYNTACAVKIASWFHVSGSHDADASAYATVLRLCVVCHL